jgi:hypothetical protein
MSNTNIYRVDGEIVDEVTLHHWYVEECREANTSITFGDWLDLCDAEFLGEEA